MSYSLENTIDLTNLGDAIRTKTSTTATMTVAEMATAVNGITIGGSGNSSPEIGMTYGKTNNIINIDYYGYVGERYYIDDGYSVYPTLVKTVSGKLPIPLDNIRLLNDISQINITIHNDMINYLPRDFLQLNNYYQNIIMDFSFPSNCTFFYIGGAAFYNTNIELSSQFFNSLRYIGEYSFSRMRNLPAIIDFSNSNLLVIRNGAFQGSQGLTTVTIPINNLRGIDGGPGIEGQAFGSCEDLTTVYFVGDDWSGLALDGDIFGGSESLTDIYVPWSEGDIDDAPWGAENATIHYNWAPSE